MFAFSRLERDTEDIMLLLSVNYNRKAVTDWIQYLIITREYCTFLRTRLVLLCPVLWTWCRGRWAGSGGWQSRGGAHQAQGGSHWSPGWLDLTPWNPSPGLHSNWGRLEWQWGVRCASSCTGLVRYNDWMEPNGVTWHHTVQWHFLARPVSLLMRFLISSRNVS